MRGEGDRAGSRSPFESRRRDAAFEELFELLEVYRHLLGSLPARRDCKQLADAVTLEVELEVHA